MMEKILKKYTTIPQALYVERNADHQLRKIVEEMQRPGYVLVARQMGKTNLLFNAKRTLENPNRLFGYVDLSNLYENEEGCYRNIIDNILEPNEVLFKDIENQIFQLRKENLPPHKEYSRSLRIILSKFQGDLVIVLDEIDALKSVDYSDNIFAQIRSNYFSRTNFPAFERLTYILSGVIEPTELIKDRNKSPFNIGEKIYLDDFSKAEHSNFIERSNLKIKSEVSDAIFYWAGGNPRLTFDICSEIERVILENETIDSDKVELIVKAKYLTTFDVAPIDHIRELVKTNRQIRSAIVNIHKDRTKEISDDLKRRLYLYGIINSNFNEKIVIKNKIIQNSLSEEWIKSVDKQNAESYTYGLDQMEAGNFAVAIESLLEFLENSLPTKLQIEVCNYNLGFAYYKTRDLDTAISFFSKDYTVEQYRENSLSLLAICKIGTGKIDEGISDLETIVKSSAKGFALRNALLNLAPLIEHNDSDRALKIYEQLYVLTDDTELSESEISQLKTHYLFSQAKILHRNQKTKLAESKLELALRESNIGDSIQITYFLLTLNNTDTLQSKIEFTNQIIENEVRFVTENFYDVSFQPSKIYEYINFVYDESALNLFESLLDYSYTKLFDRKIDKNQIAYEASGTLKKNQLSILSYLNDRNKDDLAPKLRFKIARDLSVLKSNDNLNYIPYFEKYVKDLAEIDTPEATDIFLFALAIRILSERESYTYAVQLCEIILKLLQGTHDEKLKLESIIIYYWLAHLHISLKNLPEASKFADTTLMMIEASKQTSTSMIDKKGLKLISGQLLEIKKSSSNYRNEVRTIPKIKPNQKVTVKYTDGRVVEKKFKLVQDDLASNKCILIN